MSIKIGKYNLVDFLSKERYRSIYISYLRKLFNKIANELNELEKVEVISYNIGDVIVVSEELRNKLQRIDDFERIHIIEQYMYRFLACPKCIENKACIHCNCPIPERMFVRTDHCSLGYWKEFMNKKEWEEYKEKIGIKFKLQYV